jgi:hypothetical protein
MYHYEQQYERAKEQLVLHCPTFNCKLVVDRLFCMGRDLHQVCISSLTKAIRSLNIDCNEHEARLILKRFDSNYDGFLSHSDLSDIFIPKDYSSRSLLLKRIFSDRQFLTNQTLAYVTEVLTALVKAARLGTEVHEQIVKGG